MILKERLAGFHQMHIVVVGGLPCSGKSKFAARLRERAMLPLLTKDAIKERLFDMLGYSDRAWSKRVSEAAYAIMFEQALELARCDVGCILEGNFREHEHRERFAELAALGARFVQVHCRATPEVLIARFRERAERGLRHAGHVDAASLLEIEAEMRSATQAPLALSGALVTCDTSVDWQCAIDDALARTLAYLALD